VGKTPPSFSTKAFSSRRRLRKNSVGNSRSSNNNSSSRPKKSYPDKTMGKHDLRADHHRNSETGRPSPKTQPADHEKKKIKNEKMRNFEKFLIGEIHETFRETASRATFGVIHGR